MLLESWVISSLYTACGLTKYFLDYHRFLARSSPTPRDDKSLEEHQPQVEKFIELSCATKEWDPPMYLNTGSSVGIGIPIGGGSREEVKTLAVFVKPVDTGDGIINPTGFRVTDTTFRSDKQFWINTPDTLKSYIEQNSLSASSFPAILPLNVQEYNVARGATVWKHRQTGIMGSNRLAVVKAVAAQRNLKKYPFVLAAMTSAFSTVVVVTTWNSYYDTIRNDARWYLKSIGLA